MGWSTCNLGHLFRNNKIHAEYANQCQREAFAQQALVSCPTATDDELGPALISFALELV